MSEKVGKKIEQGIWENVDANGVHDGTYCVRLARRFKIDDGARSSKPLFYRRRRIESLAKARKEKRKGEDYLAARAMKLQKGDKTWADARREYQEYLHKRLDDKSMSPSTVENIRLTLDKHTTKWNTKMLSWFNIEVFEEYLNSAEIKKDLTLTTRKAILKYIRQVFKHQIAKGLMNNNPTNGVYIRKSFGQLAENVQDEEPKVMQKEHYFQVLDFAQENFPQWAIVYEFAFNSGLRSGEVYSLVWKNIDFEREQIHVKTSYDWKTERILPTTKGKKDRIVPMVDEMKVLLKKLKLASTSEFVLPRIDDWRNGKGAEVLRGMQRAVKLPYTTNFHALRGSFCTALLLAGTEPIIVQKVMGHASFRTTQIYIDLVGLDLKGRLKGLSREPSNVTDITTRKKKTPDKA